MDVPAQSNESEEGEDPGLRVCVPPIPVLPPRLGVPARHPAQGCNGGAAEPGMWDHPEPGPGSLRVVRVPGVPR